MRIVSGNHKGRKIKAPNNLPIRPTTDMSKESILISYPIHTSLMKYL